MVRPTIGFVALVTVAAIAMLIAGANPIAGFAALVHGAFGGGRQLSETLVQTTALLFPALAVALAFRAGLFNIGAEGQLIIGGLCAGLAGSAITAPGPIAVPLILVAGVVGGGVWGGIAGVVRARFGASEVIATLMLNVIAVSLSSYLITGPFHAAGVAGAETPELPDASWLPGLVHATRLTVALPLALALVVVLRYVFSNTVFGYELRAAGEAPEAARRSGIDLRRTAFVAMTLSGAIAGLGGATLVAGVFHHFNVEISPGYGFIAIAVALVGGLDPFLIVIAAFAFGALQSGSLTMQAAAHVPKDVVAVVEGIANLGLSARRFARRAKDL